MPPRGGRLERCLRALQTLRDLIVLRGEDVPLLLRALAPLLAKPEGPIFLDCKLNADVAALDEGLNAMGFIVPGLGDAGDRQFGTSQH